MQISANKREELFRNLGIFCDAFRSYLVENFKKAYGEQWVQSFLSGLSVQQRENFERNLKSAASPAELVDFYHFKSCVLRNKELFRNNFGDKVNNLPTWLDDLVLS